MSTITIWHNPRCSKSRETLALIEARGLTPVIRRYLEDPPTRPELDAALALLGAGPRALLRPKDAPDLAADASDAAVLEYLAAHPRAIERPLVLTQGAARLGRPPEAVLEILP